AAELPLLCQNPAVCSPAIWKWYAKEGLAAKEFTDTTLLNIFVGGPFGSHTIKPIKTLDDVKALKIRAAGPSLPAAKALGINIVPLPANETYEAVQRGTVDGSLFPWETVTSAELDRWRSMLKVVPEEWLKKAQQKGQDGRPLVDDLQGMIKNASS